MASSKRLGPNCFLCLNSRAFYRVTADVYCDAHWYASMCYLRALFTQYMYRQSVGRKCPRIVSVRLHSGVATSNLSLQKGTSWTIANHTITHFPPQSIPLMERKNTSTLHSSVLDSAWVQVHAVYDLMVTCLKNAISHVTKHSSMQLC